MNTYQSKKQETKQQKHKNNFLSKINQNEQQSTKKRQIVDLLEYKILSSIFKTRMSFIKIIYLLLN